MSSHQETINAYNAALAESEARPNDATAVFNLGWWSARAGKFEDAIEAYERSILLGLSGPEEAMVNISSIYSERLGDAPSALTWLERALKANAGFYPALFNRAHLAEQLGERDTAVDYFARASRAKPEDPLALTRLVDAMPVLRHDDPFVTQLRRYASSSPDPDIFYALAKVDERLGDHAGAWRSLEAANKLDARGHPPWAREQMRGRYDAMLKRSVIPPVAASAAADRTNAPVFIVGMFRTGSTLLEQLLAAHSRFFPLGEAEFWPRVIAQLGGAMIIPTKTATFDHAAQLRSGFYEHLRGRQVPVARRVTDKRPDNLYHLPLIAQALPEARFIVTERDWRDTLLSVWATRLHPQHAYATTIRDIQSQLGVCRLLTERWCADSPGRVYRFRYEDLVVNPEASMRSLLTWLGEPWDPDCLSFHRLQNPVRTASVWQIREPLTLTRQKRWQRYEMQLRDQLGDSLDQDDP